MAVFERVDLALVQELLGTATGMGLELRAVSFENQVKGDESVPDAKISARFSWYFETKTVVGAYTAEGHGRRQVRDHSTLLGDPESLLFVLTPDPDRPAWFGQFDGVEERVRERIVWLSFRSLADAINEMIANPARVIGEQARFLLAELVALYEADGLLSADDTVIVAARAAWPEYKEIGAYVCQPNRSFREGLRYFGFYAEAVIQPVIARIRERYIAVTLSRDEVTVRKAQGQSELADLIEALLSKDTRVEGEAYDILLLTRPDDLQTIKLARPIANDMTTESGKPWAWTLGQRYTRLDKLTSGVTRTSQL
jgi:hypothetical protein